MKGPSRVGLACLLLMVSLPPWFLFFYCAGDEPFIVFETRHAILYFGLSSALLVVLTELAGLILFGVVTRRLSAWWTASLLWLAVLAFLSFATAGEWIGDLSRSQVWRSARALAVAAEAPARREN